MVAIKPLKTRAHVRVYVVHGRAALTRTSKHHYALAQFRLSPTPTTRADVYPAQFTGVLLNQACDRPTERPTDRRRAQSRIRTKYTRAHFNKLEITFS